jgi:hypothetical protein
MLETELQLTGRPLSRWVLQEWVQAMWPWLLDDPDAGRWAPEFLAAQLSRDAAT